jgi:hypothetical protein
MQLRAQPEPCVGVTLVRWCREVVMQLQGRMRLPVLTLQQGQE